MALCNQVIFIFGAILCFGTFSAKSEKPLGNPVSADDLKMFHEREGWVIVDFRTDYARDLDGYINKSILIPANRNVDKKTQMQLR